MISHSLYYSDGRVRRVAEALTRRGNEVDVISLRGGWGDKRMWLNGVNVYGIKKRRANERNMIDYFLELSAFFFLSTFWVTKLFICQKYKLIHVHNVPDFLVFAAAIPKLLGAKIILDIHDPVPEFYVRKFSCDDDYFIVRALKWIEKLSAAFADHVITVNEICKNNLTFRSVPEPKCTVLLNVPDERIFPHGGYKKETESGTFTLIYPGTLKEHFGVDVAIKAMDIVRRTIPSARLKIVGAGNQLDAFIHLTQELELEDFVDFSSPVSPEQLPTLINQADIGIAPTKAGKFSDDALSTKLLEFVTFGIPAVASKTKGAQTYLDDSQVMFFEPDNEQDLARAIIELHNSPKKKQEIRRNAARFYEEHNWHKYEILYQQLIDRLCNGH